MNRDTIKYIAVFTMTLNHIGFIFFQSPVRDILMDIGYFTAITMCYFLVEGYHYTRSKKKYGARLLIFAMISQLPYTFAFYGLEGSSNLQLNMIFNLFLCFVMIHVKSTVEEPYYRTVGIIIPITLSLLCDWSCMAPIFVLFFLRAWDNKDDKSEQIKAWVQAILCWGIIEFLSLISDAAFKGDYLKAVVSGLGAMAGPAAAAICILFFYNGKKSDKFPLFSKWFFYIYYPAHLVALGILRLLTK